MTILAYILIRVFARRIRNLRNPQLERGEVRIEDIELIKFGTIFRCLIGLPHLYSQEALRDRTALIDKCIASGGVGRPGMAMRSFLVLAVVKQRLGYDFAFTVNQHMTLRQFLDHTDSDKMRYHYQTLRG